MGRGHLLLAFSAILSACGTLDPGPARGDQPPVSATRTADGLSHLHVPPGFEVQLAAGPPLVKHPMMATLDDRGRLLLAESAGMNLRAGDLEEQLPNFIRLLEDTDGDGRYDRSTIFADRLTLPMGGVWHRGSLYVAAPPHIWRFTDANDDGVAEQREILVGKFGYNGNAASIHGCFLGPAGRLYWCDGRHGHEFRDADGSVLSQGKAARIFSCRLDGSDVRTHCGGGMDNPVEIDFTQRGEMLGTVNLMYRQRGDCLVHWLRGGVYPRFDQGDVIGEFPRTGDLLSPAFNYGHVAVSGMTRFRGSAWGAEYRDAVLVTQFNTHKVVCTQLQRKGATFSAATAEFFASSNDDFHPTDVLQDGDGSLLVIDTGGWFRIGCPTSQMAKPNILGGIYRIRKQGQPAVRDPHGTAIDWGNLSLDRLVELLGDARHRVRGQAIDALAVRGEAAVPRLASLVKSNDRSELKLGAIWALSRIDGLSAREAVRPALRDRSEAVRQAACHCCGTGRDRNAVPLLIRRLAEDQPAVRREAAKALGQIGEPAAVAALLSSLSAAEDEAERHAIVYALIEIGAVEHTLEGLADRRAAVRLGALIAAEQMKATQLTREAVTPLLSSTDVKLQSEALRIFSKHPAWGREIALRLPDWLHGAEDASPSLDHLRSTLSLLIQDEKIRATIGRALLAEETAAPTRQMLLEVIGSASGETAPEPWKQAVKAGLQSSSSAICRTSIEVAGNWNLPELNSALRELSRSADVDTALRVTALANSIGSSRSLTASEFSLLTGQFTSETEPLLRIAAAQALASANLNEGQQADLLGVLRQAGPLEIRPLLSAFSSGGPVSRGMKLIAALGQAPGAINLSPEPLRIVLSGYGVEQSKAARALLARLDQKAAERVARLNKLESELGSGDPELGRQVFFGRAAACAACHSIAGQGGRIGPDLSDVGRRRNRRDLLEAVLFPSASLVRGYETYSFSLDDGRVLSGMITRTSGDSIEIRQADQKQWRLPRTAIEAMQPSDVSIMPQGLERSLSPDQLRHLLAYLESLKPATTERINAGEGQ